MTGDPTRLRRERSIRRAFKAAAVVSVVISAAIVVSLTGKALTFLASVDPSALFSDGWFPRRGMFDVRTIVLGTLLVSAIAMLVAIPLGLAGAIYLSEYAGSKARRLLKPALEMLAGIPSVVIGFFALTWISPNIVAPLCGGSSIFNVAAAGIGVGILSMPLIASVADDSIRAVPHHIREAAYGLGAGKLTATGRVVLPAAISGLAAASILGLSRAIGETMVVAIAAGATGGSLLSLDPCMPGQTMTAAMTSLAIGSDQVGQAGAVESLFFVGLLLFAITLGLNMAGDRIVRRARRAHG